MELPFKLVSNNINDLLGMVNTDNLAIIVLVLALVIVTVWIAGRGERHIRCYNCGYQGYISEFVGGRCPKCGSLEVRRRRRF